MSLGEIPFYLSYFGKEGGNPQHKFLLSAGAASQVGDGRSQSLGAMGR